MEKETREELFKELKKNHEHDENTFCCFSEALHTLMDYLEENYDIIPKK